MTSIKLGMQELSREVANDGASLVVGDGKGRWQGRSSVAANDGAGTWLVMLHGDDEK
jgi:hypothetical protein